MRRLLMFATLGLAASTLALPPTQAWRRIFNTTPYLDMAGGIDVDASGNAYLHYVDAQPGHTGAWYVHVVKIGPTSGIYFDKIVTYGTNHAPIGILVSPVIGSKQYIFTATLQVGVASPNLYIHKWDSAGVPFWNGAPVTIPECAAVSGMYADANGNLLLALKKTAGVLNLVTIGPNGGITESFSNAWINPTNALYSTALNGWIVVGDDNVSNGDIYFQGTRWGFFDPNTGTEGNLGGTAQGYTGGQMNGTSDAKQFALSPLAGGAFAIITNETYSSNTGTQSYTLTQTYSANGTAAWRYPALGNRVGNVFQLATFDSVSPIYDLGIPYYQATKMVEDFNGSGALQWQHRNQPADMLFPWSDGFFTVFYNSSNNTEFLEHATSAGVYDWGKAYKGTSTTADKDSFAGFKGFQNSFYIVTNLCNANTGFDVVVDRFVTGIAMQTITTPSTTVQGGHPITATINLNGNAPTGGVSVGVSSSNNKLLLPNGTQGQYITVPAGQPSATVTLNAQAVTVNVPVRILAIQNGIRRFVDVTVTP